MSPSVILDTVTRAAFHTVWVFSLYLLFAGHNAPGGGFVGGLVGGAALVLRYAGHGHEGVRSAVALRPESLLGGGLLLAGATGAGSWLAGAAFLTSAKVEAEVPLLGTVKTTSTLAFDIGVYLIVVGLVLTVLTSIGAQDPGQGGRSPSAGLGSAGGDPGQGGRSPSAGLGSAGGDPGQGGPAVGDDRQAPEETEA